MDRLQRRSSPRGAGTDFGSKEKRVGVSVESGILTWRNAAGLLGVLAIMALAGGYLGALHPIGDSLAVGRAFAVIGVLLSAVLLNIAGLQIASFAATLFAMICGMQVFLAYYLPGPPGRLLIYQKNMHFENLELEALAADIRAANPLGITLQEVSESNLALLEGLKDSYPHQQVCPWGSVGGVAVASRLPMIEGTGFCAPGLAAMQVKTEGNQFWLVSIHLHWPWPYQQRDHLKTLLPVLVMRQSASARASTAVSVPGPPSSWLSSALPVSRSSNAEPRAFSICVPGASASVLV